LLVSAGSAENERSLKLSWFILALSATISKSVTSLSSVKDVRKLDKLLLPNTLPLSSNELYFIMVVVVADADVYVNRKYTVSIEAVI
jgi:hypothetical protein